MANNPGATPAWTEANRLAALDRYQLLDTPPEAEFDDIVRIAAQICGVPMAIISLVDDRRQWFKAAIGLGVTETPRSVAFCAHAIQTEGLFIVGDATKDERFAGNPLVTGDPNLRFYAGSPLVTPEGFPLGTLCVLDNKPRELTAEQLSALAALSRQVMSQLQLRRMLAEQSSDGASLQLLNTTLEQRVVREVAERMQVEEALRQAQKMDALGQLTGGIAHDFNNLLTGIIGSLDIVRRRMNANRLNDIPRFMDAASNAAQRAAALTHRLLAFARRQSLDTQPMDINRLVAGMEDLLHRTIGEQIALQTALAMDLPLALTDANQFENALLNLVINARDAMPNGGRLTIETARTRLDENDAGFETVDAGDYVLVSVADNGCGMPPDILEKAFDPFFTTKPIGQGTGLGLSMIYGFARQSAGHLRICSEVGAGTTVKLYLPCAHTGASEQLPVAVRSPHGDGETILVVEDDVTVRLLMTDVLEELGYAHLQAADAREAMPILQSRERIDLLLTDVGLPNINGRQLAEMARQARPGLRVLFVTGYAENAAHRDGFLEPGMDMLTKPFTLDALGSKVRAVLEGPKGS